MSFTTCFVLIPFLLGTSSLMAVAQVPLVDGPAAVAEKEWNQHEAGGKAHGMKVFF